MEIGIVGLGRMGGSMVERLTAGGHDVVGYDLDPEAVAQVTEGRPARAAASLGELVEALDRPRVVWVMVPHGEPTERTVGELMDRLEPDDVLVDGGNSRWTDSMRHAERAVSLRIHFLDAGVSGGVWGREEGYCLMVGGSAEAFERVEPILATLAPENGYGRVGGPGAGHFVKMIHNAIEYAQLQALGEGFHCLAESDFDLDLEQIAGLWQHGAVVRSWLLGLLERAFQQEGDALAAVGAAVDDSGTGRWSVEYAVERAVPTPALANALFARFASRRPERFSDKVVAALRNQFGGHAVHAASGGDER